jgi:8-amino-7-oxononanoate synthase
LSPHAIASIDCAFEKLRENISLQDQLRENINLFLAHTLDEQTDTRSRSAIQTVMKPGNENVKRAALSLQQVGFDVRPIVSPTVPLGSERLRICLHTFNTPAEIVKLTQELKKL